MDVFRLEPGFGLTVGVELARPLICRALPDRVAAVRAWERLNWQPRRLTDFVIGVANDAVPDAV